MRFRVRVVSFVFVLVCLASPAGAQSLLGLFMARSATNVAGNLIEEIPLQDARGEQPSGQRALGELENGNSLVDAIAWVLGHGLIEKLLPGPLRAVAPITAAVVENLAGELAAYIADTAYQHRAIDWRDLAGRSAFCAVGSALGAAFLPGAGPVVGAWIGMTFAELVWERAYRRIKQRPPQPSKSVEWLAGDAPPLGPYRAPTLRGAPLFAASAAR